MSSVKKHETDPITVIGLGKLGSPLAACLAHKGYSVIGVDVAEKMVKAFQDGRAPVFEPGLDEMMQANRARLTGSYSAEEAVMKSRATFIVVATPSDDTGGFSLKYVLPVCQAVGQALKKKSEWHLVVLTSTVMPGATEEQVVTMLETTSGKKCGRDFGLCYSPEFIALGSVIRDYLNPDFVLVGESDKQAGDVLEKIYQTVCDNSPQVARMNFVNAELTKLSVNTFVTTKITFSNTLARICERLPGADVDVVSRALGLDTRIGSKYLKGAIGYGGPCFPRDTVAFSALAKSIGTNALLADATHQANRAQISILLELIKSKIKSSETVGILGMAYKPNTDVVEQSQGILLAQALEQDNMKYVAFDPEANENTAKTLGNNQAVTSSLAECIQAADLVVVMTPWKVFSDLKPEAFHRAPKKRVLIDCWRIYDPKVYRSETDYIGLGLSLPLPMKAGII